MLELINLVAGLADGAWLLDQFVPSFSTGDPPEFAAIYQSASQALAEDPSNIQAHFQRGVVCQSKQWYPQALADFVEVVRKDPQHARAWLLMSEVLAQLGHYDKAKEVRQQAIELDPSLG